MPDGVLWRDERRITLRVDNVKLELFHFSFIENNQHLHKVKILQIKNVMTFNGITDNPYEPHHN